jgi:hypothetical protein
MANPDQTIRKQVIEKLRRRGLRINSHGDASTEDIMAAIFYWTGWERPSRRKPIPDYLLTRDFPLALRSAA